MIFKGHLKFTLKVGVSSLVEWQLLSDVTSSCWPIPNLWSRLDSKNRTAQQHEQSQGRSKRNARVLGELTSKNRLTRPLNKSEKEKNLF